MRKIKGMRAFRNILVHRYGLLDDRLVFQASTEQLGDLDTFIEETLGLVNRAER